MGTRVEMAFELLEVGVSVIRILQQSCRHCTYTRSPAYESTRQHQFWSNDLFATLIHRVLRFKLSLIEKSEPSFVIHERACWRRRWRGWRMIVGTLTGGWSGVTFWSQLPPEALSFPPEESLLVTYIHHDEKNVQFRPFEPSAGSVIGSGYLCPTWLFQQCNGSSFNNDCW